MNPDLLTRGQDTIARALDWLRRHEPEIARIEDLIAHYKAPYLYVTIGNPIRARHYVDLMQHRYLQTDGDFRTSPQHRGWADAPAMPAVRYLYPNGWIIVGLRKVGAYGPASRAIEFVRRFQSTELGGFFSRFDVASGHIDTHFLDSTSTASAGLALLACGLVEEAARAGDFLLRLLEAQPEPDRHLYTSWEVGAGLMTDVWRAADARVIGGRKQFCLTTEADPLGELTWLAGKALKFLAKLYDRTSERKYLDGAAALFDFFSRLDEERMQNTGSCKVMWGAAELYRHTREPRYEQAADVIFDALCQSQNADDFWVHTVWGPGYQDQPFPISVDIAQELCAEMTDTIFELSPG